MYDRRQFYKSIIRCTLQSSLGLLKSLYYIRYLVDVPFFTKVIRMVLKILQLHLCGDRLQYYKYTNLTFNKIFDQ